MSDKNDGGKGGGLEVGLIAEADLTEEQKETLEGILRGRSSVIEAFGAGYRAGQLDLVTGYIFQLANLPDDMLETTREGAREAAMILLGISAKTIEAGVPGDPETARFLIRERVKAAREMGLLAKLPEWHRETLEMIEKAAATTCDCDYCTGKAPALVKHTVGGAVRGDPFKGTSAMGGGSWEVG